jgi:hypothetical protein
VLRFQRKILCYKWRYPLKYTEVYLEVVGFIFLSKKCRQMNHKRGHREIEWKNLEAGVVIYVDRKSTGNLDGG